MHDPMTFETRLADAYERYVAGAPATVDARAVAATATMGTWATPSLSQTRGTRLGRLALAATLLVGLLVGAAVIGGLIDVVPTPTSTPGPSTRDVVNGPIVMVIPTEGVAEFQLIYPDANGPAVTLPIVGGTGSCPTFSPDGQSLAYVGYGEVSGRIGLNPRDLVISRPDGTAPRSLQEGSFDGQSSRQVVWSADSSVVVVTESGFMGPNGESGLLFARRDEDHASIVFANAGELPGGVSLSPDGREVAWIDRAAGGVGNTIIVASTVIDVPRRNIATDGWIGAIAWSPDGRSIAFIASRGVGIEDADVRLIGLDGLSAPLELDPGSQGNETHLAWSPDGQTLAVSNDTGYLQLFDAAGGKVRRIDVEDGQLTWAPDSRSILVAVRESLSNRRALRVDIESSVVSPIPGATGFYAQCPISWGPLSSTAAATP